MKKGDLIEMSKLSNGEYKASAELKYGQLMLKLCVKAEKPGLDTKIFLETPTFRTFSELCFGRYTESKVVNNSITYTFSLPVSLKDYVEERFDISVKH